MNKQRLNLDQLRHDLVLEEFKYWDFCRNEVDKNYLNDIERNIQHIKATIKQAIVEVE